MHKKKNDEKNVIVASPNRRPYGARLALLLGEGIRFKIGGECVLLTAPPYILKLEPNTRDPHRLRLPNHQCFNITAEAFSTAGEAEQAGLKIALAFMWGAVAGQYSARLLYQTPLPCSVYDRTTGGGISVFSSGRLEVTRGLSDVVDYVDQILSSTEQVDQKLLVALELFASARLETTERARFVGMVSSLEPLADQKTYDDPQHQTLLNSFQEHLQVSSLSTEVKNSLRGRIALLNKESIVRAIKRLVAESLPDDVAAAEVVEEAYNLRSRILHDGATDADLGQKSAEIDSVIRRLFKHIVLAKYRQ